MKTTAMEKGRGDTGSEMWNQVLLGNGRVEDQWWWPILPTSAHDKFHSHTMSSAAEHSLVLVTIPISDHALPATLPLRPSPLQLFPFPEVT